MKKFFQGVATIALDVLLVCLVILWRRHGLEGAGNMFLGVSWTFAAFSIATALSHVKGGLKYDVGPVMHSYLILRFVVKVLAYSWLGLFWLLATYLVGQLLIAAMRHQYTLKTRAAA